MADPDGSEFCVVTPLESLDLFSRSWTALRTAVADLPDEDFERQSGCAGWLVRDLVCHLVIRRPGRPDHSRHAR